MNSRQESKLSMYHTVLRHFEENETLIKTIVPFENAITELRATVEAISKAVQQQLRSTTGATLSKNEARSTLTRLTVEMADALYAYAADTSNHILKEAADLNRSDLRRYKDEELAPQCTNILQLAQAQGNNLDPYGIAPTTITALKTAADNYTAAVTGPRHAIAQRVTYRKNLEALYKKADAILKDRIDKLVPRFLGTNADFVSTFAADRSMIKPYSTVTQLRGVVLNSETQKPVRNASIQLVEMGLSIQSSTTGGFLIKPLQKGAYTLNISKPGFVSQVLKEVDVVLGQLNRLQVSLVPVVEKKS